MVVLSSVWTAVVLSSAVMALPASKQKLFRKVDSIPTGWSPASNMRVDKPNEGMNLQIYLKQPGLEKFQQLALRIATPDDELYGKHLQQHEIDAMLAPSPLAVNEVKAWLKEAGITGAKLSSRGDALHLTASVSDVEQLLNTKYEHFVHVTSGQKVLRTLQYSLPEALHQHVELVSPTTFFGFPNRQAKSQVSKGVTPATSQAGCSGYGITPSCLSSLYNYGGAKAYSNGLMGIAGFLEEYPSKSDLTTFMNRYATQNNAGQSYSCVPVNDGQCPSNPNAGLEAALDTQYVRAITEKIPNVYYSTGGRPPANGANDNEPYLEWLNYMLSLSSSQTPQTISISYIDSENTVPVDYQKKTCDLFSQLGAKGVSIFVASGDDGVGKNCPSGKFNPMYPADCPWITAVGGTDGYGPEKAWYGSGGGFSNVFPMPDWQKSVVSSWLQNNGGNDNRFNHTGRAYPDIAAQATHFQVITNGYNQDVYGTSASCPTVASLIQLINSDRMQNGKSPLGFLNPWLYSKAASALHDIVGGSSGGCNNGGFDAVQGWDPVTGLGTPDYAALLRISQSS